MVLEYHNIHMTDRFACVFSEWKTTDELSHLNAERDKVSEGESTRMPRFPFEQSKYRNMKKLVTRRSACSGTQVDVQWHGRFSSDPLEEVTSV